MTPLPHGVTAHNVAAWHPGALDEHFDAKSRDWLAENRGARWPAPDGPGTWLARVPDDVRRALNPSAQWNAMQATGAELRAVLAPDARLRVTLQMLREPAICEVFHGPYARSWHVIGPEPTTLNIPALAEQEPLEAAARDAGLAWSPHLTRVLLPWRPAVRVVEVALRGDAEPPAAADTPPRRMLCYGSSITHGASAVRPTGMWAQRLATQLGADLINLGFGGGAHLEPAIAAHIAARTDWDFATLELGVNVLDITPEDFAARVHAFVDTVLQGRPDAPLFIIDVFRLIEPFGPADRAARFRTIIRDKVRSVNRPHVHHVDGLAALPYADGLTVDRVHPSPHGMECIARHLAGVMAPRLAGVTR